MGQLSFFAKMWPNSVDGGNKGKCQLEFTDGDKYEINFPTIKVGGTLLGKRLFGVVGQITLKSLNNNLQTVITINPDERGVFGKLFSSKATYPDRFTGFIAESDSVTCTDNVYSLQDNDLSKCSFEGDYTDYINMDGKEVWKHDSCKYYKLGRAGYILDSDSLLREDLLLLKNGDEDEAAEAKTILEERQRRDKKLREKGSKKKKSKA